MIAVQEARDPSIAFKILDLGAEKNPDEWLFPFNAGHIAMMNLRDFGLAEKYFERCMRIPGAPDFVERLRANAIFKRGDLKTAWETWLEIYESAPDERTKKIASNHLYNIKMTVDTGLLNEAVGRYENKYGHRPSSLEDLARTGFVPAVPKDLDGKDYVYAPETGEVKAPIIPWRR